MKNKDYPMDEQLDFKFSAHELMEKIIELRIQLDYQIVELPIQEVEDIIQYNAKELISTFEQLKFFYPEEFQQFLEINPKYKPLEVISKDNSEGLKQIISCISADKDQTITAIAKQVQTHHFHQWVKKNSKDAIISACETEADQTVYVHMSQFNLPQVKQEEIGDCIALAFSGKLSENFELFQNPKITDSRKQRTLRSLMVNNRKYINWDFKSLTIEDQTPQYQQRKTIYRPRGIAARKIIDSSYTDGENLFTVISTSNSDTSSQGSQAFEIYKTLQANFEKQSLTLEDNPEKNLIPSVIVFNNAFFCTENPEKIKHIAGTSEKEGYHHNNSRVKFDNLFDNPLSKNQLDKINGLVTLSMLGNKELSWPRFPHTFDICDLIYCNPLTAGSDTLWLNTKFEQLKIYSNPQRTQKFFNFLLDYANDIGDSLLKIKPNANEAIVGDIKNSYERLIAGITRNFNAYNLGREINEEEIKKLTLLDEKITDFNINQPNQTIDSNLSVTLTQGAFEHQGKKLIRTIEKRQELFDSILKKEQEQQETILQLIEEAKSENNSQSSEESNIFKKLDEISYAVYKGESSGKVLKISDYLSIIQENIKLANITNSDYLNIPSEYNPNYNYIQSFLRPSGIVRQNFEMKLDLTSTENQDLSVAFENADNKITSFIKTFHTKEGRESIIEQGGIIKAVETLCQSLQTELKVIQDNSSKKYEEFQDVTPFNDRKNSELAAYWKTEIEKAIKFNNYDGMVAIIYEYLHRIEDKFAIGDKVSGKSFAELPNKIYTLKKMADGVSHVQDAISQLVYRYNYLGEKFDEQNKDKKKYKPKHYRIC